MGAEQPGLARRQAAVLVVAGLAFVAVGVAVHLTTRPYPDGITTTGVVAEVFNVESGRNLDEGTYTPLIEFVDPSTGTVHQTVREVSTASQPTIGEEWRISFRPDDPDGARVLGRWDIWFAAMFFVPGVIVAAVGGRVLFPIVGGPASRTQAG